MDEVLAVSASGVSTVFSSSTHRYLCTGGLCVGVSAAVSVFAILSVYESHVDDLVLNSSDGVTCVVASICVRLSYDVSVFSW